MERCVTDSTVTKVLIVCDKVYADKANSRTGGVGDETVIISGEIYGKMKQEKFIPIIVELDEDGHPYLPAYIQSRIYINLADEEKYEEEYEKLVRNIYAKPLYRKPKLGNRPEWLDEENRNFFPLIDLIRQINGANSEKKKSSCVNRFLVEYIETLKSYNEEKGMDGEQVYLVYFTDESGVQISDVQKIIADKTSTNNAERTFRCNFNLKSLKYDKMATYYLVIADEQGLQMPQREEFQIDIAFAVEEFDFFS